MRSAFRLHTLAPALILSAAIQVVALATPLVIKVMVDRVLPHADQSSLLLLGMGMLTVGLVDVGLRLARGWQLSKLKMATTGVLTRGFVEHLIRLPLEFFQRRSAGDLLSRVTSLSAVRDVMTAGVLAGMMDGALSVIALTAVFLTDARLGVLVAGAGFLQVIGTAIAGYRLRRLVSINLERHATVQRHLVQLVTGARTIKAAGGEEAVVRRWSQSFDEELKLLDRRGRVEATAETWGTTLRTGATFVILWVGAHRVIDNEISVGTMLALSGLAIAFLQPLANLVNALLQLMLLRSYYERLADVLNREPLLQDLAGADVLDRICASDVAFRYGPNEPYVLHDLSFEIRSGERIVLTGSNGSGKTTLAHMILGMQSPTAGEIAFRDSKGTSIRLARQRIGFVPQHPFIFEASVADNVSLLDDTVDRSDITRACEVAGLTPLIESLPLALETMIGPDGASLSGGERQLIAVARALVRQPSVVIFDEATSNLDALREQRLFERLHDSQPDSTFIFITHRKEVLPFVTRVLVLGEGRLVFDGSPDDAVDLGYFDGHASTPRPAQYAAHKS